jgi:hypothetical protein
MVMLLVVTIGYAFILNRRLVTFRKDRAEMEALAKSFAEATAKAEASVQKLRGSTDKVGASLDESLEAARSLRDDLAFLIDRGSSLADRLEDGVRNARDGAAAARPRPAARGGPAEDEHPGDAADEDDLSVKSEAERELIRALQSVR